MGNKFQFFNNTGQRGVPTKSFGTLGQQCPGENGTSGHFSYCVRPISPGVCSDWRKVTSLKVFVGFQ